MALPVLGEPSLVGFRTVLVDMDLVHVYIELLGGGRLADSQAEIKQVRFGIQTKAREWVTDDVRNRIKLHRRGYTKGTRWSFRTSC